MSFVYCGLLEVSTYYNFVIAVEMFSHDNQTIQYYTHREEVFGSGINPSIRHCFLACMKNKNKVSFYC